MEKPLGLIVEDDREIAALFRQVLDLAGFQTEVISHGSAAVQRLSNSQPDLVLLDLNLPVVSGSRILEMIRNDSKLNHTRVIVITAHAHMVAGLTKQADLVLLKPVSLDQLARLIDRLKLSEKSPRPVPLQHGPQDRQTGLYNQPFFRTRLESSLRQSREIDRYQFAVLLFKVESKGEKTYEANISEWESVLHEVAASLRAILRPTDTIARFDGDTFYILIENIPNGEISIRIANRIQEILYRQIPDIGKKITIPIRIGILLCDQGYRNIDLVLNDARYALALAIAQGDEYARFYYQVSAKKQQRG